jgi:hypothetical protein
MACLNMVPVSGKMAISMARSAQRKRDSAQP